MGSTRERIGSDGSVRYAALYRDLKGRQRSAGTFTTQRQADRAWQRAESKVAQGQLGEPGRGRQTFRDYAEKTWLPNHEVEATTRAELQLHPAPAPPAGVRPDADDRHPARACAGVGRQA